MKVGDLIALFRSDVRDEALPQLWSDADIVRYLNSALNELAVQADYFYDTTTYKGVRFVSGDPLIPTKSIPSGETLVPKTPSLSPILRIRRAKVVGRSVPLDVLTLDQMDEGHGLVSDYGSMNLSNWETSQGTPRILVTDAEEDAYRLAPIPNADGSLDMLVFRRPLFVLDINDTGSWKATCARDLKGLAGIKHDHHEKALLLWMRREAHLKSDAETYDETESKRFEELFTAEAALINNELQRRRFPTRPVSYGGL